MGANLPAGVYKVFHLHFTHGSPEERLAARFMIKDGQFYTLEDHDRLLQDSLPDGQLNDFHHSFLHKLMMSGYFKLISESDINMGHHEDMIGDLDIGPTESDGEFMLTGLGQEPLYVEMYGDVMILNGQRVEEDQLKDIRDKIQQNVYKLTPI